MQSVEKKRLILFAVLAGAVNGLLGTGGGVVLVLYLSRVFKGKDDALKSAVAVTLLCTLLMSAVSAAVYLLRGSVTLSDALPFLPAALIGGLLGALIFSKIKPSVLNLIFSLLVLWAGVRMLL